MREFAEDTDVPRVVADSRTAVRMHGRRGFLSSLGAVALAPFLPGCRIADDRGYLAGVRSRYERELLKFVLAEARTMFEFGWDKVDGGIWYFRDALLTVEKIMEKFPKVTPFGYSDNFTYCRLLLMLACAQRDGERDYSGAINHVLGFFAGHARPCGGIETGWMTGYIPLVFMYEDGQESYFFQ